MRRGLCALLIGMVVAAGAASASGAAKQAGCPFALGVSWKHGASRATAHGISCEGAIHVVRYALNHGLLAPAHNGHDFFVLRRRHVLGFTFTADSFDHTRFHARKGAARITFNVCWLNVDC